MFSLLYGLFQYFFTKPEYYAVIVGLDSAGKSTLVEATKPLYAGREGLAPDQISPTVGLNSMFLRTQKNEKTKIVELTRFKSGKIGKCWCSIDSMGSWRPTIVAFDLAEIFGRS
jgi:hypothetical protein